jgi:hypothetical protein
MKERGKKISDMEKRLRGIQTVIAIMVILRWVRLTEKVFILGPTVKFTMESGYKVSNKAMGSGEDFTTIHILGNGLNLKRMVMESTLGKMVIVMRVNGICV